MLNGSLDTVALPDVLRLIASSGKSGLLRVTDASPSGRIFIVDGRIAFATNRNEDDPIDDLLHMEYRADYVGSAEDRRIVDLSDLMENNPDAFNRFLEQMIVEVLSRLLRVAEGEFRFDLDIRSRREIPYSFEVEEMISQAEARAGAWTRILEVVPSVSAPFRMAPRLEQDNEIVLAGRDWALLAATAASTTINQIAQDLKIFEFAAAKKVAELTERGLVEFIPTEVPAAALAAAELLSNVAEKTEIQFETPLRSAPEPAREEEVDEPEPEGPGSENLPDDSAQVTEDGATDEEMDEETGPTWLPVEETGHADGTDPLLEELHRLHEADAAAKAAEEEPLPPTDENDAELAQSAGPEEGAEDAAGADSDEDGDLATRWKNLRKARRGVHASNE